MLTNCTNMELFGPANLEEILLVLKSFTKDKCPSLVGWTVDLFLNFFGLMRQSILDIVEESRTLGRISSAINSTFLALIPKSFAPTNFGDF